MLYLHKRLAVFLLLLQSFFLIAQDVLPENVYGGVTAGYGYESNPLAAGTEKPIDEGGNYMELFAYAYMPLNKKLLLKGELYVRDYSELDIIDFRQYLIALQYNVKIGDWKISPSIGLAVSEYGSEDFQTTDKYALQVDKKLSENSKLQFLYQYSDIASENNFYDYLAGRQNRFRFDYKLKTLIGKIRIRYQLDMNDRLDLDTADYSPRRNSLAAKISQSLLGWNLGARVEYRKSDYERARNASGFIREDDRLKLGFEISKRLAKQWKAGLLYDYVDNDSNLADQQYFSNDYQIFVTWSF